MPVMHEKSPFGLMTRFDAAIFLLPSWQILRIGVSINLYFFRTVSGARVGLCLEAMTA
jgi:hypothetical protein